MERIKQCLILAAGNGTRLRAISADLPKPLVEFQGRPILEHIVRRAQEARIEEFVIVLGYRGDLIREWFESRWSGRARFTWVVNPDYHKSNGVSALKARTALRDNFLLLDGGPPLRAGDSQDDGPATPCSGRSHPRRRSQYRPHLRYRRCHQGPPHAATGSWTSARRSKSMTRSIPACSFALPRCSRISTMPAKTGTVRSPTACADWHAAGGCARWKSMPPGTTWIRRKRSPMPSEESLLYAA